MGIVFHVRKPSARMLYLASKFLLQVVEEVIFGTHLIFQVRHSSGELNGMDRHGQT